MAMIESLKIYLNEIKVKNKLNLLIKLNYFI